MDEARFGQQGTLTRMWAKRGSRPTALRQTRYEWLYLYAGKTVAKYYVSHLHLPYYVPHDIQDMHNRQGYLDNYHNLLYFFLYMTIFDVKE